MVMMQIINLNKHNTSSIVKNMTTNQTPNPQYKQQQNCNQTHP